jgi:hypothetical protein
MLNPVPFTLADETLTVVPPELVSVSESVLLFPVCTFPKLKAVGFAVSVPGVTPVPESARFSVGLEASLVRARVPVALPADAGVNVTIKVVL